MIATLFFCLFKKFKIGKQKITLKFSLFQFDF